MPHADGSVGIQKEEIRLRADHNIISKVATEVMGEVEVPWGHSDMSQLALVM